MDPYKISIDRDLWLPTCSWLFYCDEFFIGEELANSLIFMSDSFDEPFDEVIYPQGDPDAVSLTKRDVDLLQPDTFINDTIIDFYIK